MSDEHDNNPDPEEALDIDAARDALNAIQQPEVQALLAAIRGRGSNPVSEEAQSASALALIASSVASSVASSITSSQRSGNTIVQLTDKQKSLSICLSGQYKGTLSPEEVNKFCSTLAANAAKRGSSYTREDHLRKDMCPSL